MLGRLRLASRFHPYDTLLVLLIEIYNPSRNPSSRGSTSLSEKIVRHSAIEKMKLASTVWIEDRNQKKLPLSGALICEKAKSPYGQFKERDDQLTGAGFQASKGYFNRFQVRLHYITTKLLEKLQPQSFQQQQSIQKIN